MGTTEADELVTVLRDTLEAYPVTVALLFGSRARGTTHDRSDVDIAVQFEPDISRERRFQLLDEMTVSVTDATGIDAVDVLDLDTVGPAVGYEAVSTGTLLLGSKPEIVDLEARLCSQKLDFEPIRVAWRSALETRLEEGTYGRA